MTDDDKASDQEMANLEFTIKGVREKATLSSGYKYTGICLNPECGEEIEKPKIFCNSICAERFEKRKGLK
jgi:hypothetical protein